MKCRICHSPVSDLARQFVPSLGYACKDCAEFLRHSERALRRAGLEGVTSEPVRYSPEKKTP